MANPPKAPAFLLGIGLGGFVDGIVLHQVLQWHHMLTDTGDHFLALGAVQVLGGLALARAKPMAHR
jgi:uncharacterized membrane protein